MPVFDIIDRIEARSAAVITTGIFEGSLKLLQHMRPAWASNADAIERLGKKVIITSTVIGALVVVTGVLLYKKIESNIRDVKQLQTDVKQLQTDVQKLR